LVICGYFGGKVTARDSQLLPELAAQVAARRAEFDDIQQDRREILDTLSDLVATRTSDGRAVRLVFICTHNSRRSHMAQLWAQTAAHLFSVPGVETFSGGTEQAAFNPKAVAALQRAGFIVEPFTDGKNPTYEVRFEQEMEPVQAFSKIHDRPPNPAKDFIAVMTCSSADTACPVVDGAAERIVIPFDDPKAFDGSEQEAEKYDERCRQIAREMLYVFSEVSRRT